MTTITTLEELATLYGSPVEAAIVMRKLVDGKTGEHGLPHRATVQRLCCGLVMAALGGSALAAWERVAAIDDGSVVYADPATLQKSGETVNMWSLLDYKTAEKDASGKPYLSAKLLQEYDCTGGRGRTRYFSFHAGPMGVGQLVYSEVRTGSEWLPANRARTGEMLWKIACGKK